MRRKCWLRRGAHSRGGSKGPRLGASYTVGRLRSARLSGACGAVPCNHGLGVDWARCWRSRRGAGVGGRGDDTHGGGRGPWRHCYGPVPRRTGGRRFGGCETPSRGGRHHPGERGHGWHCRGCRHLLRRVCTLQALPLSLAADAISLSLFDARRMARHPDPHCEAQL